MFQDGPECNILAKYIVAGTGLAGQSYFDQMLPAYMYDKYIKGIGQDTAGTSDTVKQMSLAQADKMAAASGTYTEEITKIRSDVVTKYGLDSDKVPSRVLTTPNSIAELAAASKDNQNTNI